MKNVALGSSLSLLLITSFVSCDEFPQERIQYQAQFSSEEEATCYNNLLKQQHTATEILRHVKQQCDEANDCDASSAYLEAEKDVAQRAAQILEFEKRIQLLDNNQQ
jgi:dsDNA-binding SOS-regulon protein